uniref:Uncharacterized protein n=1 Tax=Pseudomonas putida TaxID=303 RepID=Q8VMP2_PSEPU|nr:hypothetical protein [Pseudomonas putida]
MRDLAKRLLTAMPKKTALLRRFFFALRKVEICACSNGTATAKQVRSVRRCDLCAGWGASRLKIHFWGRGPSNPRGFDPWLTPALPASRKDHLTMLLSAPCVPEKR